MRKLKISLAIVSVLIATTPVGAKAAAQAQAQDKQPIYRITINVVERSTKAVNYLHRSGATKIDFKGTPLMAKARGEAKVESKQGYTEVEVEFDDLQSATRFGPEFLTYVLWAITPEGRATNMGEIILNGTKSKLNVTTELQTFGMVVTAEPYFAVSQPSDAVVMENIIRKDTVGKVEEIEAKYELLQRGQYTANVLPADLKPMVLDKKTPLDLYEARNAVRIARWAGAETSAAESFDKATKLLAQAEAYKTGNRGSKPIAMAAREAVQTAEDARLITLKNQADARLDQERTASASREAAANAVAANARADANNADRARAAAQAEADRTRSDAALANQRAAEEARLVAERTRRDADLATQRASDEARSVAERTRRDADLAAANAARDRNAAELANQAAQRAAAEQAEREKQELRSKLAGQLNSILQTKDSARGLIVNMSDVLFDTGQFSLKPGAREKLAKISGIVLAYPSLTLEVEGHTDNVGSDETNMRLSESRATSVRSFLIGQGIVGSSIGSHGLGESQPVATNDTAAGRQQNRRVELVVSGDVIGGGAPSTAAVRP
jgi:outer membrane protein OmpA-like peptidoglycan-associated protein